MSTSLISDCKRLGTVKGYAKSGWGNDVGISQAHDDARNKAGEIKDADTMVVANAQREFSGGEVTGVVFNCNEKRVQLIQNVETPATKQSADVYKQAKKCQAQGGVWMNNQCVLNIE
jgi:hypothetical protein